MGGGATCLLAFWRGEAFGLQASAVPCIVKFKKTARSRCSELRMALPDMVDGVAADVGLARGGTEQAVPIITVPDKASAVTHIPS